jgi:hypothetical protein
MNWLMLLNNDTLHITQNADSNSQTLYLFNYNMCKHLDVGGICVGVS